MEWIVFFLALTFACIWFLGAALWLWTPDKLLRGSAPTRREIVARTRKHREAVVRARKRRERIVLSAWTLLFASSLALTFTYVNRPGSERRIHCPVIQIPTGVTQCGKETQGQREEAKGQREELWPLVSTPLVVIIVGAVLLWSQRSLLAERTGIGMIGLGMVGAGLVTHFSLIDKLQIGKVLGDLKTDIKVEVAAQLQNTRVFRPERIAHMTGFDPGKTDLKDHMAAEADRACAVWREHINNNQDALLLVIGSADRVRLSPLTQLRYESNVGLARARGEKVKAAIAKCGVSERQVLVLVTGPRMTPEVTNSSPAIIGFDEDRAAEIWAFWNSRGQAHELPVGRP